jgi:hypothetical protein
MSEKAIIAEPASVDAGLGRLILDQFPPDSPFHDWDLRCKVGKLYVIGYIHQQTGRHIYPTVTELAEGYSLPVEVVETWQMVDKWDNTRRQLKEKNERKENKSLQWRKKQLEMRRGQHYDMVHEKFVKDMAAGRVNVVPGVMLQYDEAESRDIQAIEGVKGVTGTRYEEILKVVAVRRRVVDGDSD